MIEFINYKQFLNPNQGGSWKLPLKIGLFCIVLGYVIFVLKELIVGLISLIFFIIGVYWMKILWNNLLPRITSWKEINYWEAMGITAIILLFTTM